MRAHWSGSRRALVAPLQIIQSHEINKSDIQFGEIIGHGGYATVYATHWQGSRTAAKCFDLLDATAKQRASLKRSFERECQVAFELRSPRVLSVFGICTSVPDQLYIIMELAVGGSVRAKLDAAAGPLAVEELWGLTRGTAMGMKYLHKHDVMHRDLKSANVLLDAAGGAKVCDFGIAHVVGHLQSVVSGSTEGKMLGTIPWMSPESFDGKAGFSSDVFSFGVFLWELATRRMPWEEEVVSSAEIVYKVCIEKVRLPTDSIIADAHYNALPEILAQCWAHDPDRRPSFEQLEMETSRHYESLGLEGMRDMRYEKGQSFLDFVNDMDKIVTSENDQF